MGKPQDKGSSRAAQSQRKASDGIWTHAVTAIAIALLGICSAFGVTGWQLISQAEEQQTQARQAETAKTLTGYFNSRINDMRRSLTAAGSSGFAAQAVTKDAPERLIAGAQLQALLPYARRVDIIPRGRAEVDLNADTPISFAALDVIKRAESAEFVGPEAAIGKRNVLYAASPITREGVVAGVLFVAFSHDFLLEPMSVAFNPAVGTVSLLQQFEGTASLPVLVWGSGSREALGATTIPLTVPHWQLQFQSADRAADSARSWQSLLMPLGLAAGLTLCGIALGFSRLSKKLLGDAELLTQQGTALLKGRSKRQRYALPLFSNIASALENQSDVSADGGAPPANSKGAPVATAAVASVATDAALADADEVAGLLADDDDDFLDVDDGKTATPTKTTKPKDDNFGIEVTEQGEGPIESGLELDAEIFRAYDIRGITTTNLTEDVVYWIGRAFAAEAADHEQTRCAIGRDGRLSSPGLARALTRGLTEGGIDVIDIGQVPTPLLYFATHALDTGTGIMITGSHNPPDYNGLKMMLGGTTLAETRIKELETRIRDNNLSEGHGKAEEVDIVPAYMERVLDDVAVAQSLKVVVDCGNGVAGDTAPALLEDLGCEVIPLYCEVDGKFPNHHPDPAEPENLEDLMTVVKAENADLGLAFDGDGDRLGVVTPKGEIIWPDKLMMLFSQDIVSRNPGADIIFDVKCSRHLNNLISEYGGRPIMWKTGHSHIKAKMKETGALLGGEFSGHVCFGERWYGFDDALYSAARLLEIVAAESVDVDELFAQFPVTFATPEIKIQTTEREKFEIMAKLEQSADFGEGTITAIDGIRVDFDDGWGLVRPSNTSPVLSLRFEADGQSALDRVQDAFQEQLLAISPALKFKD
ncbi:MAG: phosphomannomutase/phosphoglucomutase [Pseudomonadales bacterium]